MKKRLKKKKAVQVVYIARSVLLPRDAKEEKGGSTCSLLGTDLIP